MSKRNIYILLCFAFLLTSCNGFFETDNTPKPTPLVAFNPTLHPTLLWRASTLPSTHNKQSFIIQNDIIYIANEQGQIAAFHRQQGNRIWQVNIRQAITSGIGADGNNVVVVSRDGNVTALDANNGNIRWQRDIQAEVLAAPSISRGMVVIKTSYGQVFALRTSDGQRQWSFIQEEPDLILHSASAPVIYQNSVIVGFANGNLTRLSLSNGDVQWQQRVAIPQGAFAIERMVDIDANPLIFDAKLYAATYQGNLAKVGLSSGDIDWSHAISTYTGLVADGKRVYVTDAQGAIWAFQANTGKQRWRVDSLTARHLTAPVLQNNYLVVADAQGFIHWLDKNQGKLLARTYAGAAVSASPTVVNGILYTLANNGVLSAFRLG